jgi:pyruvate dehydrogenase E2 component (dihydrolipoamide acetyltransferase)
MAIPIEMPKLSDTMEEGVLSAWLIDEGEEVSAGDGQLRDRTPEPVPAGTDAEGRRIKASPLARRIAQEHGVELAGVEGSGPEGRIVRRDVEARIEEGERAPEPAPEPAPAPSAEAPSYEMPEDEAPYETEDISQMRKTIARRLAESKYSSPHFYLTVDIDVEKAVALRADLNELAEEQDRAKISFNDLITKACALSLREHPFVNASYLPDEGEIRKYNRIHIGIAVAIDEGLITPVVRDADQKGLAQIAKETRELAERARTRELEPEEFEGATFTTSNLGMFGVEEFTAIINPPNSAILAIGEIRETPVVEDGEVVPGTRMKVTLSCDHRVVDGAIGAQFLASVRSYLEEPMNLLL